MDDVGARVEEVLRRLGQAGGKLTRPRRAVVAVLAAADRPLPVADVVDECGVPLSSVYRILVDLERRGLVDRVVGSDEAHRYELSQDLAGRHHHLMCTDCGTVVDIDLPEDVEQDIARTARAADPTLAIQIERLDVIGRCGACR